MDAVWGGSIWSITEASEHRKKRCGEKEYARTPAITKRTSSKYYAFNASRNNPFLKILKNIYTSLNGIMHFLSLYSHLTASVVLFVSLSAIMVPQDFLCVLIDCNFLH